MKEEINEIRSNSHNRLFTGYKTFLRHIYGYAYGSLWCTLSITGLKHP